MGAFALSGMLLAALAAAPPQARTVERTVQRVHLRHGDYIDGKLDSQSRTEVLVQVDRGLIALPRWQVMKIESVTMQVPEGRRPEVSEKSGSPTPRSSIKPLDPNRVALEPVRIPLQIQMRVDRALALLQEPGGNREEALGRLMDAGLDGALYLATLLETLDPDARNLATTALVVLPNPKTTPNLIRLASSRDPQVRAIVASLLGLAGGSGVLRPLRALLKDKEPPVRAAAVVSINALDDPDAFDAISELCADPDPATRAAALEVTVDLGMRHELKENVLLALSRALRAAPRGAEPDILLAIAKSGHPEAWTLIVDYLPDTSEKVRAAAAAAVGLLQSGEAGPALLEQMKNESQKEPRMRQAYAAERLRLTSATETLIGWLGEEEADLRRAAAGALRSIHGQSFGEDRAKWRDWSKSYRP